jgi:opacity protein-like surface antigen
LQRSLLALGLFLITGASAALAQAGPTASRAADIQVGGGFTTAASDYTVNRIRGFAFYGDIDINEHFGAELGFHQLNDPQPTQVYERTYEVGARYHRQYGRLRPYIKALYGRGVFNFPQSAGNLAYNMMVGGAGVDFRVHPRISVRADFEYQDWFSGPGLSNGLRPSLLTFGVAYHIPPGTPHGRK